uniref:polysaccharide biosynthesis C-terminal domain-containing protein n=2 Tax=Listeria seeligeri TaxID=1640 RepID=UPI0018F10CC1
LLAIKITLILSSAETVGLIVIMRPLNQMLFQTPDGTFVLQLFMPAVFLSSLIIMLSSILQGFGKIIVPAVGVGIGLVVKWIAGSILIPPYATVGASISTCIGLVVILLICYASLKQTIRVPFVEKNMLFRLVAALILMAIVPCLIEWLAPFETRLGSAFQAIISALIGGGIFLVFAL